MYINLIKIDIVYLMLIGIIFLKNKYMNMNIIFLKSYGNARYFEKLI